jgi:hypothetical protein
MSALLGHALRLYEKPAAAKGADRRKPFKHLLLAAGGSIMEGAAGLGGRGSAQCECAPGKHGGAADSL